MSIDVENLLAKSNPPKTLLRHLLETGEVARLLLTSSIYQCDVEWFSQSFGLTKDETINLICYLSAIHDIGKAHTVFQEILQGKENIRFRHEYESKTFFEKYWLPKNVAPKENIVFFGDAIALHHQKYRENELFIPALIKQEIFNAEIIINNKLIDIYHPVFPQLIKNADGVGQVLSGFIILADWLASSQNHASQVTVVRAVEDIFNKMGLIPKALKQVEPFEDMFPYISILSPMQQAIIDYVKSSSEPPMLTIIEDVPGSGKTESALYLASWLAKCYGKHGNYIALPTTMTAAAMNERFNEVLDREGEQSARLMCGDAWLNEDVHLKSDAAKWFSPMRLGLIQLNAVGTVDQAMMSVMPFRFTALRLLGLTSKVLIIDEVHAYDPYMYGILEGLLAYCRCCHIPVILLSATLPLRKKKKLLSVYLNDKVLDATTFNTAYPLLSMLFQKKNKPPVQIPVASRIFQNYQIKLCSDRAEGISVLVDSVRKHDFCGVYFADTVASSQYVYIKIKHLTAGEDIQVILLNAAFTSDLRKELEAKCMNLFGKDRTNRPHKAILVITQLGEQSIDIDMDIEVTEPAGMDRLIQRFGREWRHEDTARSMKYKAPNVYIIQDKKLYEYVYKKDIDLINNTVAYCGSHDAIIFPDDIRSAIESVDPGDESNDIIMQNDDEFLGTSAVLPISARPAAGVTACELFCQSNLASLFSNDEDTVVRGTRLGSSSVPIAIIPQKLYEDICTINEATGQVPIKLVKEVYRYKCNRPFKPWMQNYINSELDKLADMVLLPVEGNFSPKDTAIFDKDGIYVRMDCELGMLFERSDMY